MKTETIISRRYFVAVSSLVLTAGFVLTIPWQLVAKEVAKEQQYERKLDNGKTERRVRVTGTQEDFKRLVEAKESERKAEIEKALKRLKGRPDGRIAIVQPGIVITEFIRSSESAMNRRRDLNQRRVAIRKELEDEGLTGKEFQTAFRIRADRESNIVTLAEYEELSKFIAAFAKKNGFSVVINVQTPSPPVDPANTSWVFRKTSSPLLYADEEVGKDITAELVAKLKKR